MEQINDRIQILHTTKYDLAESRMMLIISRKPKNPVNANAKARTCTINSLKAMSVCFI